MKFFVHDQMLLINKFDEECMTLRQTLSENKTILKEISLRDYKIKNEILYRRSRLWVSNDMNLIILLICEVHDLSTCEHLEVSRIIKLLQRNYYWLNIRNEVSQYIRNCYEYQRSKISKDKYNNLLHSLLILTQRWKNISINFIMSLLDSEDHNAILIVIDTLSKERHYILYLTDDEEISVEVTVNLLVRKMFRIYELLSFIVSDREFQFMIIVWKSFYKRLSINSKLSTVFHSQINEQTKRVNQNVER